MKKTDKQTFSIGGLTALIASLCCIGPLVLIMLGLGTASTALSIGSKKPYFLVFGLIFFVVSLFMFVRYRRKNICEGCSTKEQEHKRIINTVLVAFITFIVLYALLVYAIVPKLAPIVYKNVEKETNKIVSVENLRYTALAIDGMWCAGCAVAAENAIKRKTGVIDAKVGLKENLEGMGEVIYNPKQINLEEIIKAVEPYNAKVTNDVQTTTLELKNLAK